MRTRARCACGAGEICAEKSAGATAQKCSNSVGATRCGEPYAGNRHKRMSYNDGRANVPKYSVETIEAMQKHLLSYRDNLRVEVEFGVPVVARTVAELRALSTWPGHLVLDVHIDLDPRFSVVTVRPAS